MAFTVTVVLAVQPPGKLSVIVVTPVPTPSTTPENSFTVATDVLLLVQVPPVATSLSVTVKPIQSPTLPPNTGPKAFTVTTVVAEQPVGNI